MGFSDLVPALHERRPWNAGQNVGAKRPLKARDIWAIGFYLDEHKRLRDRALFDLTIDSKLGGCEDQDQRCHQRWKHSQPLDGHSAEDWEAGAVRNHDRSPKEPYGMA
jgi:hypothetical protein